MMRILWIDQFKKMLKNKLYPLLLGFILFVVILSFASVRLMIHRLETPYDAFLETQNVEDFHITFGQIEYQYLTGQQRLTVCMTLAIMECVGLDESDPVQINYINRIIQERIFLRPDLYDTLYEPLMLPVIEEYDLVIERSVFLNLEDNGHTYRFISINHEINLPLVHQGRLPESLHEIAIYQAYADKNQLSIGDTLRILNNDYTITGYFYSPDHILPSLTSSTLNYDAKTQSLVLATEETIFDLNIPFIIKYQGLGDFTVLIEDFDVQSIQNAELRFLGRNMQMIRSVLPQDMNFKITAVVLETQLAKVISNTFLWLFLAVGIGITLMYLKHYIDEQERDLILLKTLGYSNHTLSLSVMSLPVLLAFVILVAYLFGIILSLGLFSLYAGRYQMPYAPFQVTSTSFWIGCVIPIGLMLLFSYGYIRFILYKSAYLKTINKMVLMWMQVRRSTVSIILFSVVSILLLFSISARNLISGFKDETMEGNHYETIVILSRFSNQARNDSESFTSITGKLTQMNQSFTSGYTVQLYGIDSNTTLKRMENDAIESNILLDEGVFVTQNLATSENLNVGDTLTLRIGNVTFTKSIVGIHNDLIERAIYLNRSDLNATLGFDETYFNAYYSTLEAIDDEEALLVLNYQDVAAELETLLRLSNQLTLGLMSLAIVIALSMFYFITISRLNEETLTFMTLKALGYYDFELYKLFFIKTWGLVSAAFIVSFGFVYLGVERFLMLLYEEAGLVFKAPQYGFNFVISYLLVSVLIGSVTYLVYLKMKSLDISTYLKQ